MHVLARAAHARRGLQRRCAGRAERRGRPQGGAWGTGIFCQGAYPAWMYALLGGAKLLAISISVCAGAPVWVGSMLCVAPSQWRAWGCCRYLYFYSGLKSPCQVQQSWLTAAPPYACQGMLRAKPGQAALKPACAVMLRAQSRPQAPHGRATGPQPNSRRPRPPAPSLRVMCRTICEKGALSGSPLVA